MRDLHTKFQKKTIEAKVSNNINKSIINRIFGIIKSLMETIVKSFKNGVARLPGRQNPSH